MDRRSEKLDEFLAKPMFFATTVFLVFLAAILHLHELEGIYPYVLIGCLVGMALLYPLYLGELLFHLYLGSNNRKQNLLFCLLPPLRMGARGHVHNDKIWLPMLGWQEANAALSTELDRRLSVPMIVIALMILPLMGIELFAGLDRFQSHWFLQSTTLGVVLHSATGIVWLAFTAEFIVMIAVVDKKIRYCREHWIDLAIILFPIAAFLRCMRLARLARPFARTTRIWRIRGLAMRLFRALLMVEAINRIVRGKPQVRLARLEEALASKEEEVREMREEIHRLREIVQTEMIPLRKSA